MAGIYLTQEGKQEIEAKIEELRNFYPLKEDDDFIDKGKQLMLEEILASATILPTIQHWDYLDEDDILKLEFEYPNGVIIPPKQ